jgi:hypothetical protein
MNQIQSSLDWPGVQTALEAPVYKINKFGGELRQMSDNIGSMIKALSIEEIECRRQQKQTRKHKELLDKINECIADYERNLTFAVLLAG